MVVKTLCTDLALEQLDATIKYLEEEFTAKRNKTISKEFEKILALISYFSVYHLIQRTMEKLIKTVN